MFVNTNSERRRMRVSSSAKIIVEDQLSVYSLLADAAARAPQATAITFLPSMESEPIRLTHGAFLSRLHRMARLFRGLGVARGDVVTLLAPNIPDAVVALWAAEAIGIAHPVNTLLRAQDIAAIMRGRISCACRPWAASGFGSLGQGGHCRTADTRPARDRRAGRDQSWFRLCASGVTAAERGRSPGQSSRTGGLPPLLQTPVCAKTQMRAY